MQTLRKKTSPLKYKNETTRFLGDGVSFKAKLIGILEVSEARGDRMCQEALSDLKMAIRAAGEHKQRITINIAIDGLRLRDEKTGDSLYHHPVHKISFIAQDMTDSRAFGYIFGSPDTGHRFFGIKTDKAASQVVIAMRDLFQVVFALKKKEIELAKQHLDKTRFTSSPIFCDASMTNKLQTISHEPKNVVTESKSHHNSDSKSGDTAVADLVDLELELNSLQQGLNQMERITPSDPFGSKDDPFGDSFTSYTKPILPPPPSSGRERSSRTSDSSSLFSPKTLHNLSSLDSSGGEASLSCSREGRQKRDLFFNEGSQQDSTTDDWLVQSKTIFEEPALVPEHSKNEKHKMTKEEILSQFDVFTELDPLELKNPPKKVLNDLVSQTQNSDLPNLFQKTQKTSNFTDPFGEDPFVSEDPFAETDFAKQDPFETEFAALKSNELESFRKNKEQTSLFNKFDANKERKLLKLHEKTSLDISSESECAPEPPPRPDSTLLQIKPPPLPPKKLGGDLSIKPPPRPPHVEESHYDYMDEYETAPNSLEFTRGVEKSPPLPLPARKLKFDSDFGTFPDRPKKQFNVQSSDEDYLTPISLPETKIEDVPKRTTAGLLPPPQRVSKKQVTVASYLENKPNDNLPTNVEGLDITLTQLTLSGLNELATKLNIPPNQLSNMTLVQLTNYLSSFVKQKKNDPEPTTFHADFAANFNNSTTTTVEPSFDRYAVFRELMKEEIKQTKIDTEPEQLKEESAGDDNVNNIYTDDDNNSKDKYAALREIVESELKLTETKIDNVNENEIETDILNIENKIVVDKEKLNFIETPQKIVKSPVPVAVTEIMHTSARLNSGSLSDVVSGSSPEVDNTGSNSEMGKKAEDAAAESWAIFDQGNVAAEVNKERQGVQSEEGVSPWSSDSKEFGNGSPSDWRRADSGSDNWSKKRTGSRDQEGWWDTSAEPEVQYHPRHRRSTDSYEEEYYECYERPRRKKQTGYVHGGQGGHSSSSRDVSPWEEEPRRRVGWMKHARQHSFEKHREMRHADSWDDDDDYEYEEEHVSSFHRPERSKRELERERYGGGGREHDVDRWEGEWMDERRHRRRREGDRDRWCCPDWDQSEQHEKPMGKTGRWPNVDRLPGMWRDRKYDERYYNRESQESPWEDDYSNEADEIPSPHYLTAKRNWKRPSSASEMDRKTGEIKSKHYLSTGGSDGERDRRYKPGRRSRSRDSHYSEFPHRHKTEANSSSIRAPHRPKQYPKQFENEFSEKKPIDNSKSDHSNKKSATMTNRKKSKESPKSDVNVVSTFPRKATSRAKSLFENDFVPSSEDNSKVNFEDMETSEAESPTNKTLTEPKRNNFNRQRSLKEAKSPRLQNKPKSLFEDDFSRKAETLPEDNSISSIKEEADVEGENAFCANSFENATNRKKKFNKHRLSSGLHSDVNIKKSESVNIFARENDPFDDDFFSENAASNFEAKLSPKPTDLKWTDDFEDFDNEEGK